MKISDLVAEHRYVEAVEMGNSQLRASALPSEDLTVLAVANLCLGHYETALEGFMVQDYLKKEKIKGMEGMLAEMRATTCWLMGRPQEATSILKKAIDELLDGSITYADSSGGCNWGLLLWFMSLKQDRPDLNSASLRYLKNHTKRKSVQHWPGQHWPGPLANFVLGRLSELELLESNFGTANLSEIELLSKKDWTTREAVVQALFYAAETRRLSGDAIGKRDLLQICARVENPHFAPEWYLARFELGMDNRWEGVRN